MIDTTGIDLNALLGGAWSDEPPEPFDPFTILEGMRHGRVAAEQCMAAFARYTAGKPLVRHHNAPMHGWSFLCPDPRCERWQTEFKTTAECRTAWLIHCDSRRHEFTPAWPADVPFDAPTQPVTDCGWNTDSVLVELIEKGQAVDVAGRLLTNDRCLPCDTEGWRSHRVISGLTCPGQTRCSKCGVGPGQPCDRSTRELSPINFNSHGWFSGHYERFKTAEELDDLRWAAGDLTLPAPWREEMPPTSRRSKVQTRRMRVTLRVEASPDTNPMWQSLVREFMGTGRFAWQKPLKVAHIAFPDVRTARWMAGLIVEHYGVAESAVTVEESLYGWHEREIFESIVHADAMRVLMTFNKDTPLPHLVWAAGVIRVGRPEMLVGDDLAVADLATDNGGGVGLGYRYDYGKKGLVAFSHENDLQVTAPWSAVTKMIRGKLPPELRAEMRAALAEERRFPRWSRERDRARRWGVELAMQAWMLVRPADMREFQVQAAAERRR